MITADMSSYDQVPSFAYVSPVSTQSADHSRAEALVSPVVEPSTSSPAIMGAGEASIESEVIPAGLSTLTKDYQSENADYTIRSSDGIDFKVHSHGLKLASPYFKKIMQTSQTATSFIVPTSGFSEGAAVKVLLDVIYNFRTIPITDTMLVYQVVSLAEHLECDTVLEIIKKELATHALVGSPRGPSTRDFRLAYRIGDYHLMALIAQQNRCPGSGRSLRQGGPITDDTGIYQKNDEIAGGLLDHAGIESPFFELGGLSYGQFIELPPSVLWALARSTYLARKDQGQVDVVEMAEHFEKLLKLAYPGPVPQKVACASSTPIASPVHASDSPLLPTPVSPKEAGCSHHECPK